MIQIRFTNQWKEELFNYKKLNLIDFDILKIHFDYEHDDKDLTIQIFILGFGLTFYI